ncbi:heavy metal translocating P-type ATPase [Cohnella sp. JJ-181]|uniref:heavy metal translocating P-type ATPase n=1 Tax=Cohnella rhizoplanae TaxID=2974897 RepID=UPI0022FF568A|nr:cation-translocating P-type ATPase [Cohnella sp. JJ-181]CAI6087558.1 Cadmium-transporting ATPase [Cohnella sp. JJ-181]
MSKEIKFKKSIPLLDANAAPPCEDSCCSSAVAEREGAREADGSAPDPSAFNCEYLVQGMDCSACAVTIERAVGRAAGVRHVQVNYSTGKMKVATVSPADGDRLPEIVKKLGYTLQQVEKPGRSRTYKIKDADKAPKDRSATNIMAWSGVLLLLGFIGRYTQASDILINLLLAVSIVIGGYKPAKSAFYAVKSRSLDMNVLMTVAILGAAAIGEWLEGATVVWLFAWGNLLQTKSIDKTRSSIRSLLDLTPPEANVKRGADIVRLPVGEVSVGQFIVVRPGEKIPLDGEVVLGTSSVNQASITGESIPVDKEAGDTVFAGTLNGQGLLEIRVTKLAEDTTISKIIEMVETAQEQKAPTEAFADRFARIYTPIVFIAALLVMVVPPVFGVGTWAEWFYRGLELLVIACPCALVISTPVAVVSAIGNAASNGILIKGGAHLEMAGKISAIAFDKTGTLTEGKPNVTHVRALRGLEDELLSIASALEAHSTHPIAKAVVAYAQARGIPAKQGGAFRNIVGKGVAAVIDHTAYYAGNAKLFEELQVPVGSLAGEIASLQAKGNTIVLIGSSEWILGFVAVADTVRPTSVGALTRLRQAGVRQVVMLTGDNEGTAQHMASVTGVTRYYAELMPEDKVTAIQQLQSERYKVAMVGDGINDAPALATADLGIAMGGAGNDTAMETADVVLMADNLEKLPHLVHLSRSTVRIVKQNIWFSLIVKAAALTLIFPGLLTLWMAVLSDTGAAILVILNSMRLMRVKR